MSRNWLMLPLLTATLVFLSQLSLSSSSYGKPPKGGKEKGGPGEKASKDLRKAYDTVSEVSMQMTPTHEKLPRQWPRLLDQAREFYRTAKNNYDDGDPYRAGEMAKAANDAGRGLRHVLRATLPPVAGLPAPPVDPGPPPPASGPGRRGTPPSPAGLSEAEAASLILQRARDRIVEVGTDMTGQGKVFLDASRDAYDQARRAYLDRDYARAAELARGSEAWTHVGEHLTLAHFEAREALRDRRPPPPPPDDRPRRGPAEPRVPPALPPR